MEFITLVVAFLLGITNISVLDGDHLDLKKAGDGFAKKCQIEDHRHTGLSLGGVHLGRRVLGGNHLDVK